MKGSEEMSRLRGYAVPLAAVAAIVLFYLQNPWVTPPDSIMPVLTVAFWVLADPRRVPHVRGPQGSPGPGGRGRRAGVHALPVRQHPGRPVLAADPPVRRLPVDRSRLAQVTGGGWIDGGGSALLGFWKSAVNVPAAGAAGKAPITFEWYRTSSRASSTTTRRPGSPGSSRSVSSRSASAILAGALVGIAAFFGATMNMSFMLAGSASTNPVLFFFEIGLILAWRVAGYYGVDRYLLPRLGVPWHAKVTEKPRVARTTGLPAH